MTKILATGLILLAPIALAQDWPQFRGADQSGIASTEGLLETWPEKGPTELWRARLGEGFSGLSVVDGRVVTAFADGDDTFVGAFSIEDGTELWRTKIDKKRPDRFGNGPRSTPTIDDGRVFAVSSNGKLVAVSLDDGKEIWKVDLKKSYGARVPQWGISTSPIVDGKKLLMNVGGTSGSAIVAFDKKSGKELWKSQADGAGYAMPVLFDAVGKRHALFFTDQALVAVDPESGELLWRQEWKTSYEVNAATPIPLGNDRVFVSSGYDVGAAVYELKAGDGAIAVNEIWKNREMKNQFSSSVLYDGFLYGFDDKTLKCVDPATGETRWRARGFGHGSLLVADGHLIVLGDGGKLALVEATSEGYNVKSEFELFDAKAWTVPTLVGGTLLVRNEKELIALKVAG